MRKLCWSHRRAYAWEWVVTLVLGEPTYSAPNFFEEAEKCPRCIRKRRSPRRYSIRSSDVPYEPDNTL